MKALILSLILGFVALPFAACDTQSYDSSHRNPLTGSVTHENTTVTHTPIGDSVDQTKTTTH